MIDAVLASLDAELASPNIGELLIETRNSVYCLSHGRISGGIIPAAETYAQAKRVGSHLVVRDQAGRLIVETSSVQRVFRQT